jgi:hypothetical protein
MQNLQGDFAPFAMDRIGNVPMVRQMAASSSTAPPAIVTPEAAGAIPPVTISATPWRRVRRRRPPVARAVGMFFQPGVHGPHQHTVFQLGEPQVERGE